jgi:hypothetical protein
MNLKTLIKRNKDKSFLKDFNIEINEMYDEENDVMEGELKNSLFIFLTSKINKNLFIRLEIIYDFCDEQFDIETTIYICDKHISNHEFKKNIENINKDLNTDFLFSILNIVESTINDSIIEEKKKLNNIIEVMDIILSNDLERKNK